MMNTALRNCGIRSPMFSLSSQRNLGCELATTTPPLPQLPSFESPFKRTILFPAKMQPQDFQSNRTENTQIVEVNINNKIFVKGEVRIFATPLEFPGKEALLSQTLKNLQLDEITENGGVSVECKNALYPLISISGECRDVENIHALSRFAEKLSALSEAHFVEFCALGDEDGTYDYDSRNRFVVVTQGNDTLVCEYNGAGL